MKKYFDLLNIKKQKIIDLKQILEETKNKIIDTENDINLLSSEYNNVVKKINDINSFDTEKNIKDNIITGTASVIFLFVMILIMVNSFNFSFIQYLIYIIIFSLSTLLIGNISIHFVHLYFDKKRKKSLNTLEELETKKSILKKDIDKKKNDLSELKKEENFVTNDITSKELYLKELKKLIISKCVPLLDKLLEAELQKSNSIEYETNLKLLRNLINNNLTND